MPIRRILCPVDFSDFSRASVGSATALARACKAEITALFVFPFVLPPADEFDRPVPPLPDDAVQAAVAEDLRELLAPARAAGIRVRVSLKTGDPVRRILEQARESRADLIVMGTHGRSGFERWMLGSVTDKVLRKASCPVLTVSRRGNPPSLGTQANRILCALDLSESSARTLGHALALGRLTGKPVTLLHVLEGAATARASARRREDARARMHAASLAEGAPGCTVEEAVAAGKPYREILRRAEAEHAALIVLGAHGQDAIDRMFFGSTADHVVREATVPVLVVREPQEEALPCPG